jgi:hypothetical protein
MFREGELAMTKTDTLWTPPAFVSRGEIIRLSDNTLGRRDIPFETHEDIFRIHIGGMDWDIGAMIYEPADPSVVPVGADGKRAGVFLLHGGSGDFRQMEKLAHLLVGKFGFKVVSGTFPGRLYLPDPSRDWPGDTVHPDGTVRTPIWQDGEFVTPDQYDLIRDTSMRDRYGTRLLARAKPGTRFYDRMAAWPLAMEAGMIEANRRHFPEAEYSVYLQGHSTGGPMVSFLSQRIPNAQGVLAAENSPFGYIDEQKHDWAGHLGKIGNYDRVKKKTSNVRKDPFNDLYIRSWRDHARYKGPETLGQEGPNALMRLPSLMEEVFADWEKSKARAQFKAEYVITHNIEGSLTEAATVTAKRLGLGPADTEALVQRYLGYSRELRGPDVKPVPAFLFGIARDSRDHHIDGYREIVLPLFAKMSPAPRAHVTQFDAGVHHIWAEEEGLPLGIAPAIAQSWLDAITGGFFFVPRR